MEKKLKHLAKFCCKPASEIEFEAVKMAAELGGVECYENMIYPDDDFPYIGYSRQLVMITGQEEPFEFETEISIIDFIKKLRMSEEEAERLEDDRVASNVCYNWELSEDTKIFKAINGHYFKTNEDATEVTLHKRKSC
jgi:hypothetical protein